MEKKIEKQIVAGFNWRNLVRKNIAILIVFGLIIVVFLLAVGGVLPHSEVLWTAK